MASMKAWPEFEMAQRPSIGWMDIGTTEKRDGRGGIVGDFAEVGPVTG